MQSDNHSPHQSQPRQTALRTTTTVPLERREIIIRPPRGWLRISIAAIEVAFISWAVPVACTLLVFLATASNPWMLDADWNSAIRVGADAWALSYFSPVDIAGAKLDLVPLGLTLMHLFLARIGLARSKAASWSAASFFIPLYAAAVVVLAMLSHHRTHIGWTLLGATGIAMIAWATSARRWDAIPRWWLQAQVYRRGFVDGIVGTLIIALLGTGALIGAMASAWSRILSIQELLNASLFDAIAVWIAQLMFLPNAVAAASAWLTGPGFYIGIDAIHTPSRAPIEPIPAAPVLGALPHTAIGIWVVVIPLMAGVAASVYFIRRRTEEHFSDQLAHAATTLVTTLALTTCWMWLSTGGVWGGRMSLLGPRWAFAGVLSTIEVVGVAMTIYVLAHPAIRRALQARDLSSLRTGQYASLQNIADDNRDYEADLPEPNSVHTNEYGASSEREAVVDLPLPMTSPGSPEAPGDAVTVHDTMEDPLVAFDDEQIPAREESPSSSAEPSVEAVEEEKSGDSSTPPVTE
ncbi:MAG: DUF6350 family protein [Actinomycetaceae bacterium]|nr:DUF6350 family protein [Actinomycetaceae bacterium]